MKKITGLDCIMLIDDDPATNFIHKMAIKQADLDVHTEVATNGADALAFLRQHERGLRPNLIFLDINMPGMNGFEFMEAYKLLPEQNKADSIIVMLTTSMNPDDKVKAQNIKEIDDFWNKPLTPDGLIEIIKKEFS